MASSSLSSTKNDLLASLMGVGSGDGESLFVEDEIVPANGSNAPVANHTTLSVPEPSSMESTAPPPIAAPPKPSLLEQSGLLGGETLMSGEGGGGLFDTVDEEERRLQEQEERRRQEEEEEARKRAEQERQRQEQEEARRRQEQEEERRRQAQEEQRQQQQLQDQMQSIHLGAPPPNAYQQPQYGQPLQQPMYQPQQQPPFQQYGPPQPQAGFYRDHQQPQGPPSMVQTSSNVYGGGYYGSQQQQQTQQAPPPAQGRYYQPTSPANLKAGMYNAQPGLGHVPSSRPIQAPLPVVSGYGKVIVSEPLLINAGGGGLFGLKQAPHWSYQVTVEIKGPHGPAGIWLVRRRFRHVVALEDRLRQDCPGAILPPRPDKHAARALEEASAQQSAEFALQRAAELEVYLNQLAHHPVAHQAHALRLFFSLQDDMGTAWPEVSSNALTRLANVGVGAAVQLSEQTSATKFPWQDGALSMDEYSEDNAELLALQSSEAVRMGAVLQAVPKLEGAVTLLREQAEQTGAVGVELSRLVKEVTEDRELAQPFGIISSGMLRSGRRSKRLALELSAALHTFTQQYRLCRYEKMAFADRRAAIVRRSKERGKADQRAAQLIMQQRSMYPPPHPGYGQQQVGAYGQPAPYYPQDLDRMERDAAVSDEIATDAVRECNEIAERLKSEVNRIAWQRRTEWHAAVKVVASAMKEATSERLAIWQSVREQYLNAFPEFRVE